MDKKLLSISEAAQLLGVSIDTLRRWERQNVLISFRPSEATKRYYRQEDIENFLRGKKGQAEEDLVDLAKSWAFSEELITLESSLYCQTSDVFYARLSKLELEITKKAELNQISALVTAITGEIGNNSFNHNLGNWPDITGIFFGYDLAKGQIVLADRGQGIRKTLRKVLPDLKSDQEALQVAFEEYISARAPEDRGNGLKFVRDVILANPLNLEFYSGEAKLELGQGDANLAIKKNNKNFHGCLAVIKIL